MPMPSPVTIAFKKRIMPLVALVAGRYWEHFADADYVDTFSEIKILHDMTKKDEEWGETGQPALKRAKLVEDSM